jgi:hypothetical protein
VILLCIDPGQRTGIALLVFGDTGITSFGEWDIPDGVDGFRAWWRDHMNPWEPPYPELVVAESFTLREGVYGVNTEPLQVLGALSVLADNVGLEVILRRPAGRKRQVPDVILKRLNLYRKGNANRNILEAIRHGVAYAKSQKHGPTLAAFSEEE